MDTFSLNEGDKVYVANSYEGGRIMDHYEGFVVSVKPSGTVLIRDAKETDGAGTPILHYCRTGKVTVMDHSRLTEDWLLENLPEGWGYDCTMTPEAAFRIGPRETLYDVGGAVVIPLRFLK